MILYDVKPRYIGLKTDDRLISRLKLEDHRTKEIDLDTIVKLILYTDTPRIRKKLPERFIKRVDYAVEELTFKIDDGDNPGNIEAELKDLYELLYIEYPEINRKFRECMRRRKSRLNAKGQTKWESRRNSIARKKGAATRKNNIEKQQQSRIDELYNALNSMMKPTS